MNMPSDERDDIDRNRPTVMGREAVEESATTAAHLMLGLLVHEVASLGRPPTRIHGFEKWIIRRRFIRAGAKSTRKPWRGAGLW